MEAKPFLKELPDLLLKIRLSSLLPVIKELPKTANLQSFGASSWITHIRRDGFNPNTGRGSDIDKIHIFGRFVSVDFPLGNETIHNGIFFLFFSLRSQMAVTFLKLPNTISAIDGLAFVSIYL